MLILLNLRIPWNKKRNRLMLEAYFVEMNYPMVDAIEELHDDEMVHRNR